jgi:hypothetical protein
MRSKLGIPEDSFVYIFVGGGFERKGLFRLIEAFARSGGRTLACSSSAATRGRQGLRAWRHRAALHRACTLRARNWMCSPGTGRQTLRLADAL